MILIIIDQILRTILLCLTEMIQSYEKTHDIHQYKSIIHLFCKGFQCFKGLNSNLWEKRGGTIWCAIRCRSWEVWLWEKLSLTHVTFFMIIENHNHCWKCQVSISMNLTVEFLLNSLHWKVAALLRKENKSCTKKLTVYCPLCPESCDKLGLDVWDFWKKRSNT